MPTLTRPTLTHSLQIANTETGEYDPRQPKPMPFHTDDVGVIIHHASMEGAIILGFTEGPGPTAHLALTWERFRENPEAAIGRYMVTVDRHGHFASWGYPVDTVTQMPVPTS